MIVFLQSYSGSLNESKIGENSTFRKGKNISSLFRYFGIIFSLFRFPNFGKIQKSHKLEWNLLWYRSNRKKLLEECRGNGGGNFSSIFLLENVVFKIQDSNIFLLYFDSFSFSFFMKFNYFFNKEFIIISHISISYKISYRFRKYYAEKLFKSD